MTDCHKIKQKLNAFVDNELSAQERQLVEAHLAQCPLCLKEVATITQLHSLAKEVAPKPSNDYLEKLTGQVWLKIRKENLARTQAQRFFFPRFAPILALALTLILVAVIGIKFLTTSPSQKNSKERMVDSTSLPSIAQVEQDKVPTAKGKTEGPKSIISEAKKLETKEVAQVQTKSAKTVEGVDLARNQAEQKRQKSIIQKEPLTVLAPLTQRTKLTEEKEMTESWANSSRIDKPKPIEIPKPESPTQSILGRLKQKISAEVIIQALVDTNGMVIETKVFKTSGYGILDTSALKAAKKAKFEPARVRTWVKIPFQFKAPGE